MRSLICSSVAFGILSSCNPSDFESAGEKAPVGVIGKPGGFESDTLGRVVLPLPAPAGSSVAGRLFFSGTEKQALGVADFDQDGKVTYSVATAAEMAELGDGSPGIVFSAALRPDGQILVGTPMFGQIAGGAPPGQISLLTLTQGAAGKVTFSSKVVASGGADSHFGIAVGVGNITGAGSVDMVGVADRSVTLFPSTGKPVIASCQALALSNEVDPYAFRPIVVGNFLGGGTDEIVVAGLTLGQGKVVFLSYDPINNSLECLANRVLVSGAPQFGASLAAADFNGDGNLDLAVGNPPDTVYVYYGPLDTKTDPDLTLQGEVGSDFGRRLAVTSSLPPDLLVAAPLAAGKPRVGKIYRFAIKGAVGTLPLTSALAAVTVEGGEDGDRFGTSLGEMRFNNTASCAGGKDQGVLWGSTNYNIFTVFRYPSLDPATKTDPRCFMSK